MGYSITRSFKFDAAHRLFLNKGKCYNIHGHSYQVNFTVSPQVDELNEDDMVVDFSILKGLIGDWIDKHWDHALLLNIDDPFLHQIRTKKYSFVGDPTAEHMAQHLYAIANDRLAPSGLQCNEVTVWETENCFATYDGEE